MEVSNLVALQKTPWNKGKLVGRELALFNLALDSKLRGSISEPNQALTCPDSEPALVVCALRDAAPVLE